MSGQWGAAPAVSAACGGLSVALAEPNQLLVAQRAHLASAGASPAALARPAAAPGAVTRRGAWRFEVASRRKARLRAFVLLNEENKSQSEGAAQKRDPEARRASAGQPRATACHTAGTTLGHRLSVPLLRAAACLAALDRLAGRCRPCSSSYLQRARENDSECSGCGVSLTGRSQHSLTLPNMRWQGERGQG